MAGEEKAMSTPAFLQGFLSHERSLFVNVVKAVTEEGKEHRPDPRSRCSRELIEHLIGHNQDLIELLDHGEIHHRNQVPFDSIDGAAQELDRSFGAIIDKLEGMGDDDWQETGRFYVGDDVIMEAPREQLAWLLFLDSIHHRGQLSTHLRPMGSKVPAIYGPSADDEGPGH